MGNDPGEAGATAVDDRPSEVAAPSAAARPRSRLRRRRPAAGYDAFISYSHAVDGKLAPALQAGLHRFARPLLRLRALRVFRDETSLAADPALWSAIESALGSSRHLLLLASPESAASTWVGRELAFWRAHKSRANLLVVLTEGDLVWDEAAGDFAWPQTTALPESLRGFFDEEPRWIDLCWARTAEDVSLRNPRFRSAVADLAAPLHGRSKDELIGEDVRQHRRAKALAWGGVSALTTLLAAVTVAAVIAILARNDARAQTRVALSGQLAAEAELRLEERPDRALLLAVEAVGRAATAEARRSLLTALNHRPHLVGFVWPELRITAGPAATDDGTTVIVGGPRGRLIACSVAERRCYHPFSAGFAGDVSLVAVSPAAEVIAAAAEDGSVSLVDLRTRSVRRRFEPLPEKPVDLVFSPDGRRLAGGTGRKRINVWATAGGIIRRLSRPVAPTEDALTGLAFAEGGDVLAMGAYTGEVTFFDLRSRSTPRVLAVPYDGGLGSIAIDPRTGRLASSSVGGTLRLWNWRTRRVVAKAKLGEAGALAFSPDGETLLTADKRLIAIASRSLGPDGTGQEPWTLTNGGLDVRESTFAGNRMVVTRVRSDSLAIWSLGLRPPVGRVLRGRIGFEVSPISVVAGSRPVVVAQRTVLVWKPSGRGFPTRLTPPAGTEVTAVALDPSGTHVAVGADDRRIYLWRLEPSVQAEETLEGHAAPVMDVTYEEDGAVVSLGVDGAVLRWAVGSESPQHLLGRAASALEEGVLAPGARSVARLDNRGSLDLVDLDRPGDPRELETFAPFAVPSVRFVDGGSVLAVATNDRAFRWSAASGKPVAERRGPPILDAAATGGSLAATDETLAATGEVGVRLWDLESGRPLGRLRLPDSSIEGIAFGPHDEWLVTGWSDGAAVWDLTTESWLAAACAQAGRVLTRAEWEEFRQGPYRPGCRG
jgi:WD40 repeat protein